MEQPTEATLQVCEESGTDLAQAIRKLKLKKRSEAAPKFTVASNVEQVRELYMSFCLFWRAYLGRGVYGL